VRALFTVCWILIIVWLVLRRVPPNIIKSERWVKWFFVGLVAYLATVCAVTLYSAGFENGVSWSARFCIKFIFFAFLLLYLRKESIALSFDVYSNLAVLLVLLSFITLVWIYFGSTNDVLSTYENVLQGENISRWLPVTISGFDGFAWVSNKITNLARMQSYSYEPGGFALAILPSLYWFVFVRENYVKAVVIMFGVAASWSLGALLAIGLAACILSLNRSVKKSGILFLVAGVVFFVASHALIIRLMSDKSMESATSSVFEMLAGNRSLSADQRKNEVGETLSWLQSHPLGVGIHGYGAPSVGYLQVVMESGILGGLFYILFFGLLGLAALKVVSGNAAAKTSTVHVVLGLSILTCLFFGLQRDRPDASFWFMWIYASFLVHSLVINKEEANGA